MNILERLLQKRGLKRDELTPEEKDQFAEWQRVLSKDELTIGDIKSFCGRQLDIIETKWRDLDKEQSKKAELIPYHTVYKLLIQVIDSPKSDRENLEQQLSQLLT